MERDDVAARVSRLRPGARGSSAGLTQLFSMEQPHHVGAPAANASNGCFAMEWGHEELSTVCQEGTFRDVLRTPLRLQLDSSPPEQWGEDDIFSSGGSGRVKLKMTLQTSVSLEDAFAAAAEPSSEERAGARVAAAAAASRSGVGDSWVRGALNKVASRPALHAGLTAPCAVAPGRSATVRNAFFCLLLRHLLLFANLFS